MQTLFRMERRQRMKYRLCCIALTIFIWIGSAAATPVGNIADPAYLSNGLFTYERPYGVFASLEADFISDRKYKDHSGDFNLDTYGAKIGAVLRDNMMLYGFLGTGRYSDSKKINKYDLPGRIAIRQIRIKTDPEPVFGLGFKAVMYEHKVNEGVFLRIGMDASYRKIKVQDENAIMYASVYMSQPFYRSGEPITDTDYTLDISDYQGAVALSYQVDNFVPYVGFLIMESRGHESIALSKDASFNYNGDILLESNKGPFVGINYCYSNRFSLNVEARARTETALSCQVLVRF